MASENKKQKAKNSFTYNGWARSDNKFKRLNYFKKRDRVRLNQETVTEAKVAEEEMESEDYEEPVLWRGEYVHSYEKVEDGVRYLK